MDKYDKQLFRLLDKYGKDMIYITVIVILIKLLIEQ